MNRRRPQHTRLVLLFGVVSLLIACGPAVDPQARASDDGVPAVATGVVDANGSVFDALGEEQEGEADTETTAPVLAVSVAAPNDAGILMGFTRDGYPFMGNPDAAVVMEEFSDFQCPFCSRFQAQTLPTLITEQIASGEVVFVFRDFPLSSHAQAVPAANAARCAGEQGVEHYWAMHDLLFQNIQLWANADHASAFTELADQLDLEKTAFADCIATEKYFELIEQDFREGQARGVNSTPSFFLNDQPLVGAQPLDVFNQAIAQVSSGTQLTAGQPEAPAPAAAPTPAAFSANVAATLGDPGAPVTIVEFTDYQCPYCLRHATEVLPTVIQEMVDSGRVHYIIKDLPLESIHAEARLAHNAARCAGAQGAYWEMHDALFVAQGSWSGTGAAAESTILDLAGEIGLDQVGFASCLTERRFDSDVQANLDEARSLGIGGTPFFFVNGYPLNGARPIEHFQLAVSLAEEGRLAEAYVPQQQPAAAPTPSGPVNVPATNGFAIGDPDAPIIIVEYTDYQCPYCKRFREQTYPQILSDYVEAGKVYYVVKDFPLTSIHPQAVLASQATWCAGEQDAFNEMSDLLFATQGQWSSQDAGAIFAGYASQLGLDAGVFQECLEAGRYEGLVVSNLREGAGFGVTGTPAFFINGNLVAGAYPFEVFAEYLDRLLADQ